MYLAAGVGGFDSPRLPTTSPKQFAQDGAGGSGGLTCFDDHLPQQQVRYTASITPFYLIYQQFTELYGLGLRRLQSKL